MRAKLALALLCVLLCFTFNYPTLAATEAAEGGATAGVNNPTLSATAADKGGAPIPPAEQKTRSAFFTTSDGVRIHYLEAGRGRALVLIPGWTMPAWIWERQIAEFSKRYHVIAVDPRSQGESDKPTFGHLSERRAKDYKELVDHLGLKQPVLVGWSMACGELMKYVEQFGSDNIGGLVLVDGYLGEKPSLELFEFVSGWMNQMQADRAKQADEFVRSMYKKPQAEEYLQKVIRASMETPTDTAALLVYNMIAVKGYDAAFAKLKCPVLVAYQPRTRMQETLELLKSKLGDKARFESFEGDGHALFVDDAEKFNSALESFLRSLQ